MPVAASAQAPTRAALRVPDDVIADLILERPLRSSVDRPLAESLSRNGLASRALPLLVDATEQGRRSLEANSRRERLRAMLVAGATASLQQQVRAEGIPALIYKGAALGAALGEEVGERPSADVDVLIRWGDLDRVHQLLTRNGHALKPRYSWIPSRVERRLECERTYVDVEGVSVDLHWWVDTGRSFRTDFDTLWAARRHVRLAESDVETLGDMDALLVTAVHGCRELWHSAKWIVDAGRQLDRMHHSGLSRSRELAKERGCARALAATELLISDLGAGPRPGRVDPAIQTWVDTIRSDYAGLPAVAWVLADGGQRNRLRGAILDSRSASATRLVTAIARGVWAKATPAPTS